LDFLAAITPIIQPTIIIIPMGTTCGHTTLTPNYTRITTRDAHTTGITDIEFTTGTIAIITIAIELSGWRSLSKRFFTEVRPRKDHRGVDLISDALPFGRLWYGEPDAIGKRSILWVRPLARSPRIARALSELDMILPSDCANSNRRKQIFRTTPLGKFNE